MIYLTSTVSQDIYYIMSEKIFITIPTNSLRNTFILEKEGDWKFDKDRKYSRECVLDDNNCLVLPSAEKVGKYSYTYLENILLNRIITNI